MCGDLRSRGPFVLLCGYRFINLKAYSAIDGVRNTNRAKGLITYVTLQNLTRKVEKKKKLMYLSYKKLL